VNPLDQVKAATPAKTGAPAALLVYQQKWVADPSPLKIAEKSRRVGLTWAEASDDVLIASASRKAGGQNVYYMGVDKEMTEEYIDACKMWAKAFDRAAAEIEEGFWDEDEADKHIKTYTIRFPKSGFKIVAMASVPAKLRGRQGVLVADEAAFMRDLPKLIKAAIAFLLWGGKVRILSTHDGVENPFNELLQEVRAGKRKGTVHRIAFREAVEAGLYRRVCLRRGIEWSAEGEQAWVDEAYAYYGDDADEELDVVPSSSGGAFLPIALIESRMHPDTPLARGQWKDAFALEPEHARHAEIEEWCRERLRPHLEALERGLRISVGGDVGRVANLSVFVLLAEQKNLVQRVVIHVELFNCPFKQQEQILFYLCDYAREELRLRAGAIDAGGIGAPLAEAAAQRYGALVFEELKLTETFYVEQMPKFKAAFQDATIEAIPRDQEVRDDLRAIRVMRGVPKIPETLGRQKAGGPAKMKRHGDAAIALFLGHYAAKRDVVPMEFEAGGNDREVYDMADYLE
jgi:phage FluMu gp28-like protein